MKEKVNPIKITLDETGETYTLEFSRESVVFTNKQGFKRSEFLENLEEMLPILWYGAFRMHHKNVARKKTDEILFDVLGGLQDSVVARLVELFDVPRQSMFILEDEDDGEYAKKAKATVEL